MFNGISDLFTRMLGIGLELGELSPIQVAIRAFAIYGATVALVKLGSKRLLGKSSLFDAIVAIMLGSIMSGGITGPDPLLQTVTAGATLIGLHWLFATIALKTSNFGPIVKGEPVLLIKDGEIQEDQMRQARISKNDLLEALRLQAKHDNPSKIRTAYLERNGKISIVPLPSEPRILEIAVKEGVQLVRVKIE